LVIPHIAYIGLVIGGILVSLIKNGLTPSFTTNVAWSIFNIAVFAPFIKAALPQKNPLEFTEKEKVARVSYIR
jgi:hypothetical protein